jgi:murein endopeptidase
VALFAREEERGRAPGAVRGGIARDRHTVLFGGARRRRLAALALLTLFALAAMTALLVRPALSRDAPPAAGIQPAPAPPADSGTDVVYPPIRWRVSTPVGATNHGRLVHGVKLPPEGPDWFTWDPVYNRTPNRPWRRWGTDTLLRTVLRVLRQYRATDIAAPRVGIMDIARHHGGAFGPSFGGLGHASHQNGLDIDIMYPRRDERERRPLRPSQVDRERAQDLVDRFVRAGADKIFVGPSLDLRGPHKVVIPLIYHDDHLHVRMPPPSE